MCNVAAFLARSELKMRFYLNVFIWLNKGLKKMLPTHILRQLIPITQLMVLLCVLTVCIMLSCILDPYCMCYIHFFIFLNIRSHQINKIKPKLVIVWKCYIY